MKLKDIILSEISQSQKDRYHLREALRVVKFIETESSWLPGAGENGEWEVIVFMVMGFQFCKMERVLELDGDDSINVNVLNATEQCT